MNDVFREINDSAEWSRLGAVKSPFFTDDWERELVRAFPYIIFRHFIYRNTHVVRLAQIGDRMTSVPFSDGGDVVSLGDAPLSLKTFQKDLLETFGTETMLRVHDHFAPIIPENLIPDLVDFRVPLQSFTIDSVRKTLRHILDAGLSQGSEIRQAVPADTDRIYKLYLGTMHEAGGIALARETFELLMKQDVFVFVHNNIIEAASVFFSDDRAAYHFISASSAEGKHKHAPHHLLFHAIKHYQQIGKTSLFLGGTNAGSSLRTFKEGWRGDECKIYAVSGSPASPEHPGGGGSAHEAARQSPLRSLWKLIPTGLLPKATKLVGRRVF